MNKNFEKQRMSLKSSSRSLVSSDSKRAAKSISNMRNGKSGFGSSSGGSSSIKKEDTSSKDEEKQSTPTPTMKQEPEDENSYYEEKTLLQQSPGPASNRFPGVGSYPMLTRVRSHSRSLRAMANPSAVWAHFDLCVNDPLRAQCRICGAVVVRGGANPRQCGTTNLHRHLRVHHGGRLVGRRYQVMSDFSKRDQEQTHTSKALRLAAQNLVRQMRSIAPAPLIQHQQRQQRQQQQEQEQNQEQELPHQQQRPTKALVLKTIPLKVKQITPSSVKLPVRQNVQNIQGLPQAILPQQPTEVCLRWNSYHSNMQLSFPSLLDTEQFVDVTLACEGRSLKCHKMILSSCSDYLAQLLRENPCQHPIILMKDLKFWEIEALVKFMYRGEVNVAHDKLPQLLNAAEALQVKGLAGPSNSQNPKPPLLIPQTKNIVPHQLINRITNETKDKISTSTNNTVIPTPNLISAKRSQKRRNPPYQVPEAHPFTKIRLQRPMTPELHHRRSCSPTVKLEPLDIPLSPSEAIYHDDNHEEEDSCSTPPNFENFISIHEEDDPGGQDVELADANSDLDNNDDSRNNFTEHMEFVPTDFLDQEQDIVEEPEDQNNYSSIQYTDDDSKHIEEDEDEEDEEEEEEDEDEDEEEEEDEEDDEEEDESGDKKHNELRPNRTKNEKT